MDNPAESSTYGSAYSLILEHILTYQGTYEIPLRTRLLSNSTAKAQGPPSSWQKPANTASKSSDFSISGVDFPMPSSTRSSQSSTAQLTTSLMNQIGTLPSQPCSLPPTFISSFVRRCFPAELNLVDFPQSLTALDYLTSLEHRRMRESAAAIRRLGLEKDTFEEDRERISKAHPVVDQWLQELEASERKVEALYTQLYVALRRWIMINEMTLTPYKKQNCLAMLNTLYSPFPIAAPTPKLTPTVLHKQREGFLNYINSVEKQGPDALRPVMDQGKRPGDANGWPAVQHTVDSYLRVANRLIDEAVSVTDVSVLNERAKTHEKIKQGKMDSGVSFGSEASKDKPNPNNAATDVIITEEPVPSALAAEKPTLMSKERSYSRLEKIAYEIRRIKQRHKEEPLHEAKEQPAASNNITEPSSQPPHIEKREPSSSPPREDKSRGGGGFMKKMRSIGDLKTYSRGASRSGRTTPGGTRSGAETPMFDAGEMERLKAIWEARQAREGEAVKQGDA